MTSRTFLLVVSLLLVITIGCGAASFPISRSVGVGPRISIVDSPSCPALAQPGKWDSGVVEILGGDVEGLLWHLRRAMPGTTLLLEDGVYQLLPGQNLVIKVPGLTLRSASGNREAVRIEGGDSNIIVNVAEFTVADVTLSKPRFHNIQVRGERGISGTRIYNVHMLDAGQQFVKVSAGDGTKGKFADDGLVACSQIEYTTYAQGSYTNGVDILAGKGWIIRDNVFRRIRSQAGPAGPAILVWKNSMDTVIRRNLIIDSWRGIALGLSSPSSRSRGGGDVVYDHQNGLVENNVILALNERGDAAIENNYARNSRILHNTVYYRKGLNHTVNWSIEYRFPPTTAVIKNNLTNLPLRKRAPFPEQDAEIQANVTVARANWFRDILAEDYHLIQGSPAIDRGMVVVGNSIDFDGTRRPVGNAPDVGADEYNPD